ncbi:MAG: 30S ribosomal protein S2, partial [Oceanicaulis sp.]|nr:30S ribosomal protein S2 [Oceanicaulis sp.]
ARAIALYCDLVADAVLDGISDSQAALGVDLGASEAPAVEPALSEPAAEAAAEEAPAEEAPAAEVVEPAAEESKA